MNLLFIELLEKIPVLIGLIWQLVEKNAIANL